MASELPWSNPVRLLNEELRPLLLQLFGKVLEGNRPSAITLAMFLCVIYDHYPHEIEQVIANPDQFSIIAHSYDLHFDGFEFLRTPLNIAKHIELNRSEISSRLLAGESMNNLGVDVAFDPKLSNVLRIAGERARQHGRKEVGIQDFVDALQVDEPTIRDVYQETGLRIKKNE